MIDTWRPDIVVVGKKMKETRTIHIALLGDEKVNEKGPENVAKHRPLSDENALMRAIKDVTAIIVAVGLLGELATGPAQFV